MMKKMLVLLAAAMFSLESMADEGMWLPSLISSRIKEMRSKGFRLTAKDIYDINKASLKDAVVLFGGGCTGELVSAEGLLFTNHHCGYDAIQRLSSVEHDYLTYGFLGHVASRGTAVRGSYRQFSRPHGGRNRPSGRRRGAQGHH